MRQSQELRSAIQDLYSTFHYPRPFRIDYCRCGCTKPEEVSPLLDAPAAELQFSKLENYSFSAMTTQGSTEDFKYFLPRLLQGIAEEPYGYNPEILFGKLSYGKWLTWEQIEIKAIRTYLKALWREGLESYPIDPCLPAFVEIETLLASIARTGDSLWDYLDFWSHDTSEAADRHLIQFVTMYGANFADGKTFDAAFWKDSKVQATALRQWLLKPETIGRIENSGHLLSKDGFEFLFEPALETLRIESRTSTPP
jgi:hypothetical protein